jgi:hypothetical protein
MENDLDFYLQPGVMTSLPESIRADELPDALPLLVELTQNALVHIF